MNKRHLYNSLFFLLPLVYFFSLPILTGDLAVWIAHGRHFIHEGTILRQDIYSVLPTKELIYPFGASVIYAFIYHATGLVGVSVFHKVIVLIISLIWFKVAFAGDKSTWSPQTLLIVFLSWFGASIYCIDRPALFAMLPLVLAYIILDKDDELSLNDFILLNVINIFWVNIHGSWILLLLMYSWRELIPVICRRNDLKIKSIFGLLTFLLTSLANPFGFKVFPYILETTFVSRARGLDEWAPTSLSGAYQSQVIAFYLLILFLIAFLAYSWKFKPKQFFSIISSPFCLLVLMGIPAIRNTSLAFFVLIPFASRFKIIRMEQRYLRENKLNYFFNTLIVGCVVGLMILFFPTVKPLVKHWLPVSKQNVYDKSSPFLIAQYLNNTVDNDPVFNDWNYGSFLILVQKHRIFFDTRNIIYDDGGFIEYQNVVEANFAWAEILHKYKIKYLILNKELREKLIQILNKSSEWKKVMEDQNTVLFIRK